MNDFKRLAAALEKTNNGVYVPQLPVIKANEDMPATILEERLPKMNEVIVKNYAAKIDCRPLLANSDIVQAFLGDVNEFTACIKSYEARYAT